MRYVVFFGCVVLSVFIAFFEGLFEWYERSAEYISDSKDMLDNWDQPI